MKKRLLSALLALCMVLTMLPTVALASGEIASGKCGNDLKWILDDAGTLTINGTGKMADYSYSSWSSRFETPWCDYNAAIAKIIIENGVTSIGNCAFSDCSNLGSITIPNSVTSIGEQVFYDCINLTSITIPDSVINIGNNAFQGCSSLDNIVIPDGVTSIGDGTFWYCQNLKNVSISDDVASIGAGAFYYCSSLTSIVLPDSLTSIGQRAFYRCSSLGSVTFPEGMTSIGDEAFSYCDSLLKIALPNSVISIGQKAFYSCSSLGSVVLPEGVTSIGEQMFYNCRNLTNVTIPNNVTSIGDRAFDFCNSLTDVYYGGSVEQWKLISIGTRNEPLTNASIHYNSTAPEESAQLKPPVISLSSVTVAGQTATTVEWSPVTNAAYYSITVYDTTKGSYVFRDQIMDNSVTTFLLDNVDIVDGNTYEIYVKAIDANGNESEKSNVITWVAKVNKPPVETEDPADWQINQNEVFLTQTSQSWCTYAAAANMLRRRAILEGVSDWKGITDSSVRSVARHKDGGMLWTYTYRGMDVSCPGFLVEKGYKSIAQKKAYFISMLEEHPEGIVIYSNTESWLANGNKIAMHAILLTDYDKETDTFYCADSASSYKDDGRIKLTECSIFRNSAGKPVKTYSQNDIIDAIDQIWYIKHSNSQKQLESTTVSSHCPVEMAITIHGETLDSREADGIITNTYATMTTSGNGVNRNVEVHIFRDNATSSNISIELFGTETGVMTFTVAHHFTDDTTETHTFQNVPVTSTILGSTTSIYPQSTVILSLIDEESIDVWTAAPEETVTRPTTDFTPDPEVQTYTITANTNSVEGGSATGSGTYDEGTSVTVTATPNNGYRFVGWTENGITVNTSAAYTFEVTANRTLTAVFEPISSGSPGGGSTPSNPSYQIAVPTTSNGTVNVTPTSAKSGTKVTITATPDSNYKVGSVTVKDSSGNTVAVTSLGNNQYSFTMPNGKVTVGVTFVPIQGPWANPFTDVSESDWFYDGVAYVAQNELMQGVGGGRFNPSGTTSRGMIATILYRLEGEPVVSQSAFTDVAAGQYYTDAVAWAAANKIVEGYENNTFGPNDDITREQMATILCRYAAYKGYDVSDLADLSSYTDAGAVHDWALTAIRWANKKGLITGRTTTTLVPNGTATRAEVAVILARFCQDVAGLD